MKDKIVMGRSLTKSYNGIEVVKGIDFWVKKNQFLTILGPSGCGKTTTLRMLAGFESPSSGQIFFEGNEITSLPPYQRHINTVFQKYALFPHMNIYENIAFGLRINKVSEKEVKSKVAKMLELVNLSGFETRKVNSLSGGQQQRIAIARALVNEPKVLLLDEPLGALDLKLRKDMQIELKNMQKELGITFIYVTHDQEEALTMSDKIIIMNQGEIQQIGTPTDIYNEPENAFVADFIGESNILDGIMHKDRLVTFAEKQFECVDGGFKKDEPVDVVIRPEDIKMVNVDEGILKGVVKSVVFKGVHYEMIIKGASKEWMIHSTQMAEEGSTVGLLILPDDIHIMSKEAGYA
ncbi:spermidine/putrescine ABC transporter ATP-binding protein [Fusibacter sp. 3D3]|uniref:spermidine/putrescine ABC transporter ATP-binding protein n=1 Tax=Fusibacter sp. 3D3 TaxID=1048380 RepID=UPI000853C275|nr:spermidine/putrescine ABC transporter ATP-binding protein [Fusibacter sp. 3D3]GAU79454.1 putrescine transport ATP-binding protein PotA [Fusibacter sp. 3D3]